MVLAARHAAATVDAIVKLVVGLISAFEINCHLLGHLPGWSAQP